MHSILQDIIKQKHKEVECLKMKTFDISIDELKIKRKKSFKETLSHGDLSIIGEIKRSSPSKGKIGLIEDPLLLLHQYIEGGVSAISVLTDEKYFSGTADDLVRVANGLRYSTIPVLRKDFIIDEIQIKESVTLGANAILLIVSVLKNKTQALLRYANELAIDAIVEVHNEQELMYAVEIGAKIIGINNRDLNTFCEDINICINLVDKVPNGILTIAESAIKTVSDIKKIKEAGFDAVLIGEALVKSEQPSLLLRQMREGL